MSISFPGTEEKVLGFWREIDAFQTQLRLSEGRKTFTFYDGPPFATGLPHYGHLLASTIKDIIPRYWSLKGYHVVRRFGWDTHGVPIEYEIDKKHGMSARDLVKQIGVEKYNAECRAIVMTYATEWRQTIERLGRWIDFDNDYKSMDPNFMETCWWIFKQIFDKGDVYRAYQIMPFSTALGTPLSEMESKQNEKMTQDPTVVVAFPLVGAAAGEDASLLIYTTTPWTLPSNLLIAVHPDFEYMKILDEKSGKQYFILESCLANVYKDLKKAKYKVIKKGFKGKDMVGWTYEPLFPYFKEEYSDCFRVIAADYVEAGEGTGLVHQAPAFGQEDYDAATAAGIISPTRLPPCPVDEKGCFTSQVSDYAGQHVKTADKAIIKDLRATGRLVLESQVMHNDKFCWRSDTQLIRRAVSSWFIKVVDDRPLMLDNLAKTHWTPGFVKEKRFGTWVANAHDWNVSRNRYWGTPIPLWVSDDFEEVVCIGSREELKKLSGYEGSLDDIHRDKVDGITIPSKKGKGVLKRIDEIFDCWFESGSMPYSSNHYPFENAEDFESKMFPADFIAEGIDQTRGWFYTLTVLGTKLFKVSPFRNCIVNGIVLAEDGKKMSKRLKNYPDPNIVMQNYGSDALRLYLINSPVVRAETLRFKEAGVKDIISKVLLPLWNSFRFFQDQANLYKKNKGEEFVAEAPFSSSKLTNFMDRWILAECQSLIRFMDEEMQAYRLYTVVPRLLGLIDNLTNWYIRFNRKRLKGTAGLGAEDNMAAMNTLLQVLFTAVRALAAFTPFLTEHIYGLLRPHLGGLIADIEDSRSVHFLPFPTVQEEFFDEAIERQVRKMQQVIELGRVARERANLMLKTPLLSMVVIGDKEYLSDVGALERYVSEELNVRTVVLTSEEEKYNIVLEARVDWPTLGKKLKKSVQTVRKALPGLTQEQLKGYVRDKQLTVEGVVLEDGDLNIVRVMGKEEAGSGGGEGPKWEPAFDREVIVLLDSTPHPELAAEGIARELINRVQRLRKKAGLVATDDVHMQYRVVENPDEVDVEGVLAARKDDFVKALRGTLEPLSDATPADRHIIEEEQGVANLSLLLRLAKL